MTNGSAPTEEETRQLVEDWYRALDVHAPVEEVLPMLAEEGLEMTFPEGTMRGLDQFRDWYDKVTHRFFDEVHTMKQLDVVVGADRADVKLVVNWQARIWDPPAPNSVWLGFDAEQTWVVKRSPQSQRAVIVNYVVDALEPMPGSASL